MGAARIDTQACRRFVAALLLRACLDAASGAPGAAVWLQSAEALTWAELIELEHWPPTARQMGSRRELLNRNRTFTTE